MANNMVPTPHLRFVLRNNPYNDNPDTPRQIRVLQQFIEDEFAGDYIWLNFADRTKMYGFWEDVPLVVNV